MAKSSGFKINRNLNDFLTREGAPSSNKAALIFEIRSIVGKYVPLDGIQNDLEEIELASQEPSEPEEENITPITELTVIEQAAEIQGEG